MSADRDQGRSGGRSLQLEATGLTLVGVLLGIALTTAFGISGDWWLRMIVGLVTFGALLLVTREAAKPGRGLLARLARWITRS